MVLLFSDLDAWGRDDDSYDFVRVFILRFILYEYSETGYNYGADSDSD